MQIRLNKDQRRRAVMVKGQKRLCSPALCLLLTATMAISILHQKNICQQTLPAVPLAHFMRPLEPNLGSGAKNKGE